MHSWSTFIKTILTIGISLVWLINGLFCKVLDFVPRHELIVSRILGTEYASIFTKLIGIAEILMVVWILSGIIMNAPGSNFLGIFVITERENPMGNIGWIWENILIGLL